MDSWFVLYVFSRHDRDLKGPRSQDRMEVAVDAHTFIGQYSAFCEVFKQI